MKNCLPDESAEEVTCVIIDHRSRCSPEPIAQIARSLIRSAMSALGNESNPRFAPYLTLSKVEQPVTLRINHLGMRKQLSSFRFRDDLGLTTRIMAESGPIVWDYY